MTRALRLFALTVVVLSSVAACRGRLPGNVDDAEGDGEEGEGEIVVSASVVLETCPATGAGLSLSTSQRDSAAPDTSVLQVSFDARGAERCALIVRQGEAERRYALPGALVHADHVLSTAAGAADVDVAVTCVTDEGPVTATVTGPLTRITSHTATQHGDEIDLCWESNALGCSGFTYDVGLSFARDLPPTGCITGAVVDDRAGDYTYVVCHGPLGDVLSTIALSNGASLNAEPPPLPPPGLAIETLTVSPTRSGSLEVDVDAHDADACELVIDGVATSDDVANGTYEFDVDWAGLHNEAIATLTCRRGGEAVTRTTSMRRSVIDSVTASRPDPAVGDDIEVCWNAENVTRCAPLGGFPCPDGPSACCTFPMTDRQRITCTAAGASGATTSVPVPARVTPGVVSFTADPPVVSSPGSTTTLRWTSAHASGCDVIDDDGTLVASGIVGEAVVVVPRARGFGLFCDVDGFPLEAASTAVLVARRARPDFRGIEPVEAAGTTACAVVEGGAIVSCLPSTLDLLDPTAAPRAVVCAAPNGREVVAPVTRLTRVAVENADVSAGLTFDVCVDSDAASVCDFSLEAGLQLLTASAPANGCVHFAADDSHGSLAVGCNGVFGASDRQLSVSGAAGIDALLLGPALPPGGGDSWVSWSTHGAACTLSVGGAVVSNDAVGELALRDIAATTEVVLRCDVPEQLEQLEKRATLTVGPSVSLQLFDGYADWTASFVDGCTLDYKNGDGTLRHVEGPPSLTYEDRVGGIVDPVLRCAGPDGAVTAP